MQSISTHRIGSHSITEKSVLNDTFRIRAQSLCLRSLVNNIVVEFTANALLALGTSPVIENEKITRACLSIHTMGVTRFSVTFKYWNIMITTETSLLSSLWKDSMPVYRRILELPFIQELTKGTLSARRFTYYMQQDALYLIDFARALSLIAAKANTAVDIITFIKFAEAAIVGERELHAYYFNHYKVDRCIAKNNACFTYTHYLISTAATRSLEESVAAVLPCFWIYRDVGNHIHQHSESDNPYEKWILNYANEEFSHVVDGALLMVEQMYEKASAFTQNEMRKVALQSSVLEWQFWDAAYNL